MDDGSRGGRAAGGGTATFSDVEDGPGEEKRSKNPFERLGLSAELARAVLGRGFRLPTPIQRRAIPAIVRGADVIAMARTGSGKTAVYVLPMLDRLREHRSVVGIRGLILVPTRELAFQVHKVVRLFSQRHSTASSLRTAVIVGGLSLDKQFGDLAENPDIVIAAPGRLMHVIVESRLSLAAVEYFVLDEADQMLEMGLKEPLAQILKALGEGGGNAAGSPARQHVMTSATLPQAAVDFALAAGFAFPEFIRLDSEATLPAELRQWFLYCRSELKVQSLVYLVAEVLPSLPTFGFAPGVIIFAASRFHCDFLAAVLDREGVAAGVVYSAMDQEARGEAVARFRSGATRALVVTDVGARGIDIARVGAVVNFDFPSSPKHFLHRVGRTARAGRAGLAVSLVTRQELPYALDMAVFAGVGIRVAGAGLVVPAREEGGVAAAGVGGGLRGDGVAAGSAAGGSAASLGAFPDVSAQFERLAGDLERDPELAKLARLASNAEKAYQASRFEVSANSVRRAKELLGGASSGAGLPFPMHADLIAWVEAQGKHVPGPAAGADSGAATAAAVLAHLRGVKPATTAAAGRIARRGAGRRGGVLAAAAVAGMARRERVGRLLAGAGKGDAGGGDAGGGSVESDADSASGSTACSEPAVAGAGAASNGAASDGVSDSALSDHDRGGGGNEPAAASRALDRGEGEVRTGDEAARRKRRRRDPGAVVNGAAAAVNGAGAASRGVFSGGAKGASSGGVGASPGGAGSSGAAFGAAAGASASASSFDVFDWEGRARSRNKFFASSGDAAGAAAAAAAAREVGYFGALAAQQKSWHALRAEALDLAPDGGAGPSPGAGGGTDAASALRMARRWNPATKKFASVAVDAASGRAVRAKEVKRRNEAGAVVRGELQPQGLYERWTRRERRVIAPVGSMEAAGAAGAARRLREAEKARDAAAADAAAGDAAAADAAGDEGVGAGRSGGRPGDDLIPLSELTRDRALLEAVESNAALTARQQRKLKRLQKFQVMQVAKARQTVAAELKSPQEIAKARREAEKKRAATDAAARRKLAAKSRQRHAKKRAAQAAAKGLPRRSFVVGARPDVRNPALVPSLRRKLPRGAAKDVRLSFAGGRGRKPKRAK